MFWLSYATSYAPAFSVEDVISLTPLLFEQASRPQRWLNRWTATWRTSSVLVSAGPPT